MAYGCCSGCGNSGGNSYTVCCYGQQPCCKTPCCSQYCCPKTCCLPMQSCCPMPTCCYTMSTNNNSGCCGGCGS